LLLSGKKPETQPRQRQHLGALIGWRDPVAELDGAAITQAQRDAACRRKGIYTKFPSNVDTATNPPARTEFWKGRLFLHLLREA